MYELYYVLYLSAMSMSMSMSREFLCDAAQVGGVESECGMLKIRSSI